MGTGVSAEVVAAFEHAAAGYDAAGPAFAGPVAARLVTVAGLRPGWRVLDTGCGPGAVLVRAAQAVGPGGQVTGIDLSGGMLARAEAEAARQALGNVTVCRADAAAPPFPPASFDAITASLLLYLLPDPAVALAAWWTLLAPGGVLAFSWGTGPPDPRWVPVFAAADAYAPHQPGFFTRHRRLPQPAAMTTWLTRLGYTVPAVTTGTITVRYASPDQWWEASVSEGPWVTWQHIPPRQLPRARAAALALAGPLREADGSLTRHIPMAWATARRPARPDR
jgi:SAM-dependent methyltransferase